MSLGRLLLNGVAIAVLASAPLTGALAVTIPFFSFGQAGPGTPFSYSSNGGTHGVFSVTTTVNADFLNGFGGAFSGPGFTANLVLHGFAADEPFPIAPEGVGNPVAGIGLLSQDIIITDFEFNNGAGTRYLYGSMGANNPLGADFPLGGLLSGLSGSLTANMAGTDDGVLPFIITYASDVDPNVMGTERSYSISLDAAAPPLAPDPVDPNGDYRSFVSSIAGVFSTSAVPEPGATALLLAAGVASLGLLRRRR